MEKSEGKRSCVEVIIIVKNFLYGTYFTAQMTEKVRKNRKESQHF